MSSEKEYMGIYRLKATKVPTSTFPFFKSRVVFVLQEKYRTLKTHSTISGTDSYDCFVPPLVTEETGWDDCESIPENLKLKAG